MAGLTNTGLVVKTFEEINSSIDSANKSFLGSGTDSGAEGLYPTFRNSISVELNELWQVFLSIVKQRGIADAEGTQLAAEASIAGIVFGSSSNSVINDVEVTGSEGSVIPQFYQMKANSTGKLFQTLQSYTLPASGSQPLLISLTAIEEGPIACIAGDLTGTYPTGVTLIESVSDAVLGSYPETDEEFKADYPNKLAQIGGGSLENIVEAVRGLVNVTSATGRENRTSETNSDGLPPYSFEIIVVGDTDENIALKIREKSASGPTHGNTTVNTTYEGNTIPIKFSRPTAILIYIEVEITSKDSNFPATGDQLIEDNILEYGALLNGGDDVLLSKLQQAITKVDGILSYTLKFDIIDPPVNTSSNISIDAAEIASISSTRIDVTVL